ncbi:MAG: Ig-like domain-containing protein, partial [Acidobacteria bacterium]|nr:Ig-like domain-containing protein [Acidobacteriota bacterium]
VGDEITVLVRQPDGTEYRINQAAYKKADGSTTVGRNGGVVTSADGASVLAIAKDAISGQVDLKLTPKAEAEIPIPRQNEMEAANMPFGAGIQIEAQGTFTVTKELHLELPAPASATEGQRAAFIKPAKISENGQEVDIWEVVTSGRVEGGKIKTNSPPFFGLVGLAPFTTVWAFMPVRQKVVLGTVKEPTSATDATLKPVANVLCILGNSTFSGLANHLTARTNAEGYYSFFDVSTQVPTSAFVHAIDDTNGRRGIGAPASYSSVESRFLQGLQGFETYRVDIALAARSGGGGGGQTPPQLILRARSTSGAEGQDPLVQHRVVAIPSPIVLELVTDPAVLSLNGNVNIGGSVGNSLNWTRVSSIPDLNGQVVETWSAVFDVTTEGSYNIVVTARTIAADPATEARITYNFIALRNPNTRPPLEGAPFVLTSTPSDGATSVDVATDIGIEFSEPVTNLYAGSSGARTIYLEETNIHEIIGGTITSGGLIVDATTPNISSLILRPDRALDANKQYCLRVTSEVKDSNNNPLDQQPNTSGNQPFQACFTTFSGSVLNDSPIADPGTRIVISGSYAITVAEESVGRSTLRIYDIANPQTPIRVGQLVLPQRALDIAVNEETTFGAKKDKFTRLAAVVTHNPLQPRQFANVWFINLDVAEQPKIAGVTSLYIPEGLPTVPLSVQLKGEKAFIGNSPYRGVIEVDIPKSIEAFEAFDDPDTPTRLAIIPGQGFALESKNQSLRYAQLLTQPSVASSLAVLEQQVIRLGNPYGGMNVVYAINTSAKQIMMLGFAAQFNGLNDFLDSNQDGADDRLIANPMVNPQDSTPARVRAIADVQTNTGRKDLAIALGGNRLWIFNVKDPVHPEQYTSRTFAEMGLSGDANSASYFDIEGTLAYVGMGNRIAVIDFFNPENPRIIAVINGIGSNITALAVKEGFIFTLSPGSGTLDGLNVSIARPASHVFVHGYNANGIEADLLCANPIVISRSTLEMQQDAEIFFMLFGQITANAAQINIKKNNEVIGTVQAEILSATSKVIRGKARWRTSAVIDRAAKYTAEVVLNPGVTGEARLKAEPIPFSFLISEHIPTMAVEIKGMKEGQPVNAVLPEEERSYSYLLGSTARVNISVNGVNKLADKTRNVGLHVEAPGYSDSFAPDNFLTGLAIGKHRLLLSATMLSNPAYTEQVETTVTVAHNLEEVRAPGHIVVSGVDLFTGNLGLTHTDVAELGNRGLSLSLMRSYNSLSSDAFSPFGYGWHHNYQVLLVRTVNTRNNTVELTMRGGDGEGMKFDEGAIDAEMSAKPPHQGKLVKRKDGSYDFYTKARIRYHFPGALNFDSTVLFDHGYMGNLDYIEEPHGIKLQLSYNGGKLERVTDSSSRSLNFSYERASSPFVGFLGTSFNSAQNRTCIRKEEFAFAANKLLKADVGLAWRINKVTGPGGIEINYEYDAEGNLFKVTRKGTDAISAATSDAVWEYGYNPTLSTSSSLDVSHVLKSVKNPNGNTTTYSYHAASGLFVGRIDYPEAADNDFTYSVNNGAITGVEVLDGKGYKTTYTLSREVGGGHTIEMQTPITIGSSDLAVTTTRFNEKGLKIYEKDAEGLITEIAYDLNGNPVSVTRNSNAGQLTNHYVYGSLYSKPESMVDPNGNFTRYEYNGQGDLTQVKLPTNNTILMSYDSNSDLLSVKDERGLLTRYENFDQFGNPQTIRRQTEVNKEIVTNNTFDMRSRLKTSSSTLGPGVSNSYDALDRVKIADTNDPSNIRDSFTTTYAYKPGGQVASLAINGGGQNYQVLYSYDGLERLLGVTETGNGISALTQAYIYDRNSNVESATDRRGVTTTYRYNELNYPLEMKMTGAHSPATESNVITLVPDKVGNPKSRTDIYGNSIFYGYDGFHRLTSRTYPGNLTETMKLDANGNVIEFSDRNGRTTATTYDPLNRPSQVTDALLRRISYSYDDVAGSMTMTHQPQGLTVEATTDAVNRPLSQRVRFATTEYVTSYSYNGRSVQITDPRGTVVTKNLSAMGEVGDTSLTLENGALLKTEMRYAALGGVKSFKDANNRTTTFDVDALGRTVSASYPT